MQPLNKEQLEQAASILTADTLLNGVIRAWACGTHGQKALTYDVSSNGVQVRCTLCDSSNKWNLPEKQEKAKKCLVCDASLTTKETTENPELICDVCYAVGDIGVSEINQKHP